MAFYVVYIQEAHPIDAWQDEDNLKDHIALASPRSFDERCAIAGNCIQKLGIEFPALVDDFKNTTEVAYTGWPDRLYVIDPNGRIAYKGGPGPYGFLPREVDAALRRLVPSPAR